MSVARPLAARAAPRLRAMACLLLAVLLCALPVRAAEPIARDDPENLLRQATTQLLDVAKQARDYAKDDPERYYAAVKEVLDQVLDMHYFARGVMATYASARLYKSLQSDEERAAFRDRVERFVSAIERVFMVKYADALLTFAGERIDVESLPSDRPDHASVQQTIYDEHGESYVVQYSLHQAKEGGWLIYNVIVEGVNLGQIYRNQFAEAVEKHGGDPDFVVDHWVELMMGDGEAAGEESSQ
ncbi:MlaC/ttg2D family ABC transporter substrate-binding protein [Haliea sp. E17]|uniref:MlaC/ttg2D family ABC transporter substrate-binding protein n=1 Tax=Haliea sp. E17 TaxID=3401576 RepID=UPI003AAF4D0E